MSERPFDAVLLIAFGGPEKPEDIRPFLERVAAGRPIPPARLEEVAHHYEQIGGRSPLGERTRRQAELLQRALASLGIAIPVHVGMRNWHPFFEEALAEMSAAGVKRACGVILSTYESEAGWQRYVENVSTAQERLRGAGTAPPEVLFVPPWHAEAGWIEAAAARVRAAFDGIAAERRAGTPLVFTTHSLPQSMAAESPYVAQFADSCARVAGLLGHPLWRMAYQSRSGRPQDPWLEPDIVDVVHELARAGHREVVVAPIGFVCDHVEVLYDLDTEARAAAESLGMELHRACALNDHPSFIAMLAELVHREWARPR